MIGWRARLHQQRDFALSVTFRTNLDNSGTRRSPDATAGTGRETADIIRWPDRVGEPGQPVHGKLAWIGQDALREMHGSGASLVLLLDEAGHRNRRIRADAGIVVHVQHPDVVAVLAFINPQIMREMIGTCLEPRAVGSPISSRDGDHPD